MDDAAPDVVLLRLLVAFRERAEREGVSFVVTLGSKTHTSSGFSIAPWSAFKVQDGVGGSMVLVQHGAAVEVVRASYSSIVMMHDTVKRQARAIEQVLDLVEAAVAAAPEDSSLKSITLRQKRGYDGSAVQ